MMDKDDLQKKLQELESAMASPSFWSDKVSAQRVIEEYNETKDLISSFGKYDRGNVIMTLFAGAGGNDSEDFVGMLYTMYIRYAESKGWSYLLLHEHKTEHGGYRSLTCQIEGSGAYGTLKNESGVHRLVRISPFNANQKRHTSFAMVEMVPELPDVEAIDITPEDIRIELSKSSGPGGQNVNKRETAVRIVHIPTDMAVHVDGERTQEANRKKALEILRGKLYHRREEERKMLEQGLSISKTVQNEWGSQIRSYVLHPYKLVKDHRTNLEIRDVESVLEGDIERFIEAERSL